MLRQIWPLCKLYQLSERVYDLQAQVLQLKDENITLINENKMLINANMKNQKKIVDLNDMLSKYHNGIKTLDDQLKKQCDIFERYQHETADYDWYSKYGYDWMISDLQMSYVESVLIENVY